MYKSSYKAFVIKSQNEKNGNFSFPFEITTSRYSFSSLAFKMYVY